MVGFSAPESRSRDRNSEESQPSKEQRPDDHEAMAERRSLEQNALAARILRKTTSTQAARAVAEGLTEAPVKSALASGNRNSRLHKVRFDVPYNEQEDACNTRRRRSIDAWPDMYSRRSDNPDAAHMNINDKQSIDSTMHLSHSALAVQLMTIQARDLDILPPKQSQEG
jgi:hypothetical protein